MARFEKPFQSFADNHRKSADEASELRKHFVAASAEFVGTLMFLMLAFSGHQMASGQAAEKAPNGQASSQTVVFISLSYGFSLLISAWALYRVSGGLFNPAVTLGLCVAGAVPWVRGLFLLPAQILGAIVAAALVECMLPGGIATTQTALAPNMSQARGVFFEMFLTAFFVFVILMLAAEKSKDTFLAPIGIGLTLFICEIAGVYYTGASLNPARSFGPCVAAASFQTYHWIYWVGPCLGALLAAGYYKFVKYMDYTDVNPGQDASHG